jgi:hypothetical protein
MCWPSEAQFPNFHCFVVLNVLACSDEPLHLSTSKHLLQLIVGQRRKVAHSSSSLHRRSNGQNGYGILKIRRYDQHKVCSSCYAERSGGQWHRWHSSSQSCISGVSCAELLELTCTDAL